MKSIITSLIFLFSIVFANAQDGHELWLRPVKAKPVNVICKQTSRYLIHCYSGIER